MKMEAQEQKPQIHYAVQDTVQEWERMAIDQGISAFNNDQENEERVPCYVLASIEDLLVGGLYAVKINKGFYIKQVWVDNHYRGNGVGAELMVKARNKALEKNCKEIWVDTLSFQAPEFYEKLGFREAGRIEGYRAPHDRIFFRKDI